MTEKELLRRRRWALAAGWTACIYATLGIVRPICEFLKRTIPLSLSIDILIVGILAALVFWGLRGRRVRRISTYVFLALIAAAYGYGLAVISSPEEKVHFIEYGFLAYWILRALEVDYPKGWAYPAAFVLTAGLGWLDEGIQHLLPGRYYQTTDVILNSLSGALGLCLAFVLKREDRE